jgi:hypothetical protein
MNERLLQDKRVLDSSQSSLSFAQFGLLFGGIVTRKLEGIKTLTKRNSEAIQTVESISKFLLPKELAFTISSYSYFPCFVWVYFVFTSLSFPSFPYAFDIYWFA